MWCHRIAVLVALAALAAACAEEEPLPDFVHRDFYESLQQDAEHFAFQDGEWLDDYGDAAFYGIAYYARAGESEGNEAFRQRARQAYGYVLEVVQNADFLTGDVNEIAMSTLGLIEYIAATGDATALGDLDHLIGEMNGTVEVVGYYLDVGIVSGYAVETYGPTSISGLVGLVDLQRAHLLGPHEQGRWVSFAREMAEVIDEKAWNGTFYEFGGGRTGLFLYPNITMILMNARLYQQTGESRFRDRALAVYRAIQELRVGPELAFPGRYRSPYSAEHMGAQTDDYSTLSSQNYTMFALILLHEITGDVRYIKELNEILDFLSEGIYRTWCRSYVHLSPCDPACGTGEACVDGHCLEESCHPGVVHHFMDGAPAEPEHPEMFCSGCNLQLLYIMWYRENLP